MFAWISNGVIPAIFVTAGIAIFLICCLGCRQCRHNGEDPVFRRRDF